MDNLETFLRFSKWAIESLFMIPSFAIILSVATISLIAAALEQRPFRRGLWKPHHWLVFTHALFFPLVIAAGIAWGNPVTNPTVPHDPIRVGTMALNFLSFASLFSCVFWIWRMRDFRWFSVSLMALVELPVFGALFIAGMAVAGDWL